VPGLHQHFSDPNAVDSNGCFVRVEGQIRFAFGKHRGQPLDVVARMKPDYLEWMLHQTFFEDTKALVREVLSQWRSAAGPTGAGRPARS
jgi:DNA polymerase-3 subunit epsilon